MTFLSASFVLLHLIILTKMLKVSNIIPVKHQYVRKLVSTFRASLGQGGYGLNEKNQISATFFGNLNKAFPS